MWRTNFIKRMTPKLLTFCGLNPYKDLSLNKNYIAHNLLLNNGEPITDTMTNTETMKEKKDKIEKIIFLNKSI